jgi:hypothetical protein
LRSTQETTEGKEKSIQSTLKPEGSTNEQIEAQKEYGSGISQKQKEGGAQ